MTSKPLHHTASKATNVRPTINAPTTSLLSRIRNYSDSPFLKSLQKQHQIKQSSLDIYTVLTFMIGLSSMIGVTTVGTALGVWIMIQLDGEAEVARKFERVR